MSRASIKILSENPTPLWDHLRILNQILLDQDLANLKWLSMERIALADFLAQDHGLLEHLQVLQSEQELR